MYTITYNLKSSDGSSDAFYEKLRDFSHHVFRVLDEQFYDALLSFFRYRRHLDLDRIYSFEEGYLEMLSMGVFWQIYSGDALATDDGMTDFIQKLTMLREENKTFKPLIDAFRGLMMTAVMQPDLYDHMGISKPTLENFKDLLDWLEATGEFKYEVLRLRYWYDYASTLEETALQDLLTLCLSASLWFEKESNEHLGVFTEEVDRYLNEMRPKRYWKEDVIFCGRRRVEYHLNMLAAEWLNKVNRESFKGRPHKLLFVPTCLRLKDDEACQAKAVDDRLVCCHCDSLCQVSRATLLAESMNCKTFILPHSTSLKKVPEGIEPLNIAVIGVACALHLISGGWMLSHQGIAAQCVMLDYCGCKAHWHHEGLPTSLSLRKLTHILAESDAGGLTESQFYRDSV